MLWELIPSIRDKNERFKAGFKQDCNLLSYNHFDKLFENKILGLGSHKTLDYLQLSQKLPLQYQPESINSAKYTKAMHDLLANKIIIKDYLKKEES
jgi:hypothetical protein